MKPGTMKGMRSQEHESNANPKQSQKPKNHERNAKPRTMKGMQSQEPLIECEAKNHESNAKPRTMKGMQSQEP